MAKFKKVQDMLETVSSKTVYEFLEMGNDASPEDLREGAKKKYNAIQNMGRTDTIATVSGKLAIQCMEVVFKDAQSKEEYDSSLVRQENAAKRREKVVKQGDNAAKALKKAAGMVSDRAKDIARYSKRLSAVGFALILLGYLAVMVGGSGGFILSLGAMVFFAGFTALLNNGSQRSEAIVGGAGVVSIILSVVAREIYAVLDPGTFQLVVGVASGVFRFLGGLVLLCAFASFGLRNSWHVKIIGIAGPVIEWWKAFTSTWSPLIRVGSTGWLIGLVMLVPGIGLDLLFGGAGGGAITQLAYIFMTLGSVIAGLGICWELMMRSRDILECQRCGATMTRSRYKNLSRGWDWVCPKCGSDEPPVKTGKRRF